MKIVKVEDEDGNGDLKEEEADNCVPAMLSPDSLPLPQPGNSSKPLRWSNLLHWDISNFVVVSHRVEMVGLDHHRRQP